MPEIIPKMHIDFLKAHQHFETADNLVGLIQLHITVGRLNLSDSRKEPCKQEIEKTRELSKKLNDPKQVLATLEEMEKLLDRIDRI